MPMKFFWNIMGRIYEQRKDFSRAAHFYEKGGALRKSAEMLERGEVYADALRNYLSLDLYEDAARVALAMGDATAAASYYYRAGNADLAVNVLVEAGLIADAVTLLLECGRKKDAAELALIHGDLRRAATVFQEIGEEDRAIELYRKLNDLRALLAVYLKRGEVDTAAEECRRAGQPALAASLFESAGRYEEAARLLEEMSELMRAAELFRKAENWKEAGRVYEQLNRPDLAVEMYSQAPECAEKVAQLYERLVQLKQVAEKQFDSPIIAMTIALGHEAALLAFKSRQIWYTDSNFQPRWTFRPEGDSIVREMAISPHGEYALLSLDVSEPAGAEHKLLLLDAAKKVIFERTGSESFRALCFLSAGEQLCCVFGAGNTVICVDLEGRSLWEFPVDFAAWEAVVALSGDQLAVGTLGGKLFILDPRGQLLQSREFEDRIHNLCYSAEGGLIGAGVGERNLYLCEAATLEPVVHLQTLEPLRFLIPLPLGDKTFLAAGHTLGEIISAEGWKTVAISQKNTMTALCLDPLDCTILVATDDAKLVRYEPKDCKKQAAEWYVKAGDLQHAAEMFEEVEDFQHAYDLFKQLGDYDRAASNIQRLGDNRTAARHYELVGKFDRAARLYEEMGELGRAAKCYGNAGDLLRAAALYEELNELLLAADFYEQAEEHRKAGFLFKQLNQEERASENWTKWLERHPDDAEVTFELAMIYANTHRYDDAIRLLQSIQEVPEYRRNALKVMAECFIEKGLYEVAADRLLEALGEPWKAMRENLDLVYDLALAYERNGRLEEAKDLYSKILAVDFYYRDVQQKLERTREKITASQASTQLVAVGAQSAATDPYGATVKSKVEKESLRYKIIKKLGQGGMGVVYLALDTKLGRYVAWKVLPSHLAGNQEFQKRLLQEACAIAQVNNPHIVAVYDVVTNADECFITMEYVDGYTLRALLSREKKLSPSLAVKYGEQVCEALAAAHRARIIHRDVKPENIMVTADGENVKVLDFGLARLAEDANLTQEGCVVGTMAYMAPEQIMGQELDGRTDIYAFGVVLFEMLAGRPPFIGNNVLGQHLHVPPPSLSDFVSEIPQALNGLVTQCLEKNPDDRPSNAETVKERLQRIATELKSK